MDFISDCHPKLISIDEEPDHQVMHAFRLRKADRPEPALMRFAAYVAPHLVELGAESTMHLQRIRTLYLHFNLLRMKVLQHALIYRLQVRFLF